MSSCVASPSSRKRRAALYFGRTSRLMMRPAWSAQATWLVLSAALLPGMGAYWAYGFSQKVLGASRVAASLYLGPLYGGLAAWAVLREPMGWHHIMGAGLILPGIYLASRTAPETPEP